MQEQDAKFLMALDLRPLRPKKGRPTTADDYFYWQGKLLHIDSEQFHIKGKQSYFHRNQIISSLLLHSIYLSQHIHPYCIFMIVSFYNTPHYNMKESSAISEPLQHQIMEAYEEKNFDYLPYSARRGVRFIGQSQMSEGKREEYHAMEESNNNKKQYPFTALGIVESFSKETSKIAIGAIIHPRLIITLTNNIAEQSTDVWFRPLADEDKKYLVKRVHPTSIKRRMRKDKGKDPHLNLCAILQVEKKVNLEELYGSFSINFQNDNYSETILVGLYLVENTYHLRKEKLITPTVQMNHMIKYKTLSNDYVSGSLIVNKIKGEFEIIGIHLLCGEQGSEGVLLTKQFWKELKKMSYKAGELDFNHQKINQKGLEFLKQLNLKKVCRIDYQNAMIGSQELKALSALQCKVIQLSLVFNKLDNNCIEYLVDLDWPLEILSLTKNLFTSEGVRHMAKAKWRNLVYLDLEGNRIGSQGAQYLIQADWRNLEELNLRKTELGDMGCEKLRKGYWPRLTSIELNHNRITHQGVAFITNANWRKLSNISLASNQLRSEGVKQVIRAEWPKTKSIRLEKNEVGKKMQLIRSTFVEKFIPAFILL